MWLKPNAEQTFLYGNDVSKSGLGKMTENIEQHQGVVVYSLNDVPLGFAIAARSSQGCKAAEPGACVAFHQADIGEYIRQEEELF
jgi:60S ribosome subunit biogenesis protein NIP7